MKKIAILLFSFFILFFPKSVSAQELWVIDNFSADIKILSDGRAEVKETIDVDFSTEKHGIFRDIPYVYDSEGQNVYTEIEINQVLQDAQEAKVQETKNDNNLRLRIGNPDRTISGKHRYQITYVASGVIKSFPENEELYWNITGNDWEVPIKNATATISSFDDNIIRSACFEGYRGERNECEIDSEGTTLSLSATSSLEPGEGITAVIGLEKGSVPIITVARPVSFFEKLISLPSQLAIVSSLALSAAAIIWVWWKYGRDFWTSGITGYKAKQKGTAKPLAAHEPVIVEYTPPENLPPGIVGVVADEYANTLDVTSTIIDLAGRGYLVIEEVPKKWVFGKKDYVLKKTKKEAQGLFPYETELLNRLLEGKTEQKVSELKTKFYKDLAKVKEKLYTQVVEMGFFETSPEKVRNKYLTIGIVIFTASIGVLVISIINEIVFSTDISIGGVFAGLIFTVFSRLMPRKTALGREMHRRIKGYRLFIETAEKYRQKFFEDKNMFNQVLPYAIVFGLTDKFADAMRDMGIKPESPSWYHSTHAFNAASFGRDMSTFSSSLSSAIASAPSSSGFSSGGGSSGGGFGGGGGGSW